MAKNKAKLSREEIAEIEIGKTQISRGLTLFICAVFLILIVGYPMLQAGYEIITGKFKIPQSIEIFFDLFRPFPENKRTFIDANGELLARINRYEDQLEDNSLLFKSLLPPVQKMMTGIFNKGNEKALIGNGGFLFFQDDIKYLTNPGFLEPEVLTRRLDVQPDPRKAILQFKNQLAKYGIKLIIIPTPVKPMIYPDKLSDALKGLPGYLQNSSFAKFKKEMEHAGVRVFDPAPILFKARQKGKDVFLKTDTHWTPYAMEQVAKELKGFIDLHINLSGKKNIDYNITFREVSASGDIVSMLKLNAPDCFPKQKVEIKEISQGGNIFHYTRNSEVLLLGDSFTNIFSHEVMGWGKNAGFGEHIAFQLKHPLDAIIRNDAGAFATREILSKELRKGNNRLTGKKLVIWQFAIRELSDGDWKLLNMQFVPQKDGSFFVPESTNSITVQATVMEMSRVPRLNLAPYKDHVMSLHLRIDGLKKLQSLVYIQSMKDGKLTRAAGLSPNQQIYIKLRNWDDVKNKYSSLNRSELYNDNITLEPPCWGELIDEK